MLLPRAVYFALLIGCAVIGAVGLTVASARQKRGLKSRWLVISSLVVGLLGPLGCGILALMAGRAIVFEGHPPAVTYTRYMVIGTPSLEVGGRSVKLDFETDDNIHHAETWLVNRTDVPLKIESAGYSKTPGMPPVGGKDAPLPAGKARRVGTIDHIGPDDPLPTTVSSNTSVDFRTWVTW